jgi:hypothetical protein
MRFIIGYLVLVILLGCGNFLYWNWQKSARNQRPPN